MLVKNIKTKSYSKLPEMARKLVRNNSFLTHICLKPEMIFDPCSAQLVQNLIVQTIDSQSFVAETKAQTIDSRLFVGPNIVQMIGVRLYQGENIEPINYLTINMWQII